MRFIFVYTPFYTNADWILLMRRMKIMRVIKPDATKEAQESYKHYLEQTSGEQGKSL